MQYLLQGVLQDTSRLNPGVWTKLRISVLWEYEEAGLLYKTEVF